MEVIDLDTGSLIASTSISQHVSCVSSGGALMAFGVDDARGMTVTVFTATLLGSWG